MSKTITIGQLWKKAIDENMKTKVMIDETKLFILEEIKAAVSEPNFVSYKITIPFMSLTDQTIFMVPLLQDWATTQGIYLELLKDANKTNCACVQNLSKCLCSPTNLEITLLTK